MKVEAVVVRDRVETVMEAVEEQTGHVGVTVVEAVGHGREKGSRTSTAAACSSRGSCRRRT